LFFVVCCNAKEAKEDRTLTRIDVKYPKEYSKRKPFSWELMSIESDSSQYQVRIEDIIEDIEAGIFSKTAVRKKMDGFFMNSAVAWKYYGRREQFNE
jgi:hypothetical protein